MIAKLERTLSTALQNKDQRKNPNEPYFCFSQFISVSVHWVVLDSMGARVRNVQYLFTVRVHATVMAEELLVLKEQIKTKTNSSCNVLEMFSHDSFLLYHLLKNFSDEKYSAGTPPPTSPNSFTIQDTGDSYVLGCTLWTF